MGVLPPARTPLLQCVPGALPAHPPHLWADHLRGGGHPHLCSHHAPLRLHRLEPLCRHPLRGHRDPSCLLREAALCLPPRRGEGQEGRCREEGGRGKMSLQRKRKHHFTANLEVNKKSGHSKIYHLLLAGCGSQHLSIFFNKNKTSSFSTLNVSLKL